MDIGKIIANRRKELGLTQEELAEKLLLSPQAVSRWENGWNYPDMGNIGQISEVLNMSPAELIGENRSSYEGELRDQLFSEDHMFTRLKTIAEVAGLRETYKALYYIREQHDGQYRKKLKYSDAKIPYIIHPLMMACHAQAMKLNEDELLAVILLHDVCEDCGIDSSELPFTVKIKNAVELLTKKPDYDVLNKENTERYYAAIQDNRLAAMAKVIDRCNNVSTMAQAFTDQRLGEYIKETEQYVFPLLTHIKQEWPEYANAVFLIKYHMLSVLESLKIMMKEK